MAAGTPGLYLPRREVKSNRFRCKLNDAVTYCHEPFAELILTFFVFLCASCEVLRCYRPPLRDFLAFKLVCNQYAIMKNTICLSFCVGDPPFQILRPTG